MNTDLVEASLAADLDGMRRLYDLHAKLAGETDLRAALEEIVCAANEFLATDRGCILLVSDDGERLEMYAWRGWNRRDQFVRHCMREGSANACDAALRDRQRLIIEDIATFPPLAGTEDRDIALAEGIRAIQHTPIFGRNGALLGVLSSQFRTPHRPSDAQLKFIDMLAWTAADFIERHKANESLHEIKARQAFLLQLSDALRPLGGPQAVREETARQLGQHLNVDRAFYAEVNERGETCFAYDYCSPCARAMAGCLRLEDFGAAVAGNLRAGHTLVVPDVEAWDALAEVEKQTFASFNIRALLKVPVIRRGRLAAFLALQQAEARAWTQADVSLATEVAERTWGMVERATAEESRRISDEKYRSLFDNVDEGFCVMETEFGEHGTLVDLRFREVNRAFARQSGLHDVVGKSVHAFLPHFNKHWGESILRVMRTGEPARVQDRQADSGRWYSVSYSRIGGEGSRLMAAVFEDTTDRVRHEIALRDNQARLQQANRAKDDFIAMLGHELRNPLAPIVNALQVMKLRAPDVLVKERDIIDAQARYLTELVDDLLDASRFTRGEIKLKTKPVDMADVVGAAVETASPLLEEHRQTLQIEVPPGCIVNGDRRRLVQVVVNLLSNAAKYSPPERIVRLDVECENQQMVLRVCDQGQGIAPELLPHIFEMFTQESQSMDRARGGLGLGLAIVRNLVELHGGSVEAASEGRGKGATFRVRLPLLERRRGSIAVASHDVPATPSTPNAYAEKTRVLIIDDYALAADSLSMLLTEMGYCTQVAYDGVAGLDALDAFHPDVALIDIGLPVMNGYEVVHRVRSMPKYRNLPLVAVTGYGQSNDIARAKQAGFDEHLVKPLDAAKIGELIDRLVKGHQA